MRESTGIGTILGLSVVGALIAAGNTGARADGDAPPSEPASIEVRVPEVPAKWVRALPLQCDGDLQGFAARIGESPVLTPAVEGKRVFAGDVVEMRAFDAVDGRRLWSARVDDSEPTAPAVSSGHVYFNTQSCTLYGVEASSGHRDWSNLVASSVASTPAVLGDRVFVTGPGKDSAFKLEAYAVKGGALAFRVALPADAVTAPVVCADRIYLALADGTVMAMDRDGKELWKQSLEAVAAPWPAGDRLLVASGDRVNPRLLNIDAQTGDGDDRAVATPRDGEPKKDGEPTKMVGGDPGVKGGGAGRPGGSPLPPTSPGEGLGGGPMGRGRGSRVPPPPPPSGPSVSGAGGTFGYEGPRPCVLGSVVAMPGGTDLVLRCLAGGEVARVALGDLPAGAPVAAGTMFVQATRDGRLLGIDPVDGAVRFRVRITRAGKPLSLSASPAILRGRAYVGTPDGLLLAFDLPDASADGWPMWGGSATRSK